MPTYLFENSKAEVVELSFSMASCPKAVLLNAHGDFVPWDGPTDEETLAVKRDVFKKIVAPFQIMIPFWMQAKNDTEVVLQHQMHNEPNPANPGGKSDAQLVKDGVYKTKDMSRWL